MRRTLTGLAVLLNAAPALAADWPCVQRKVPEVSLVSVWNGEALVHVKASWRETPGVADLVERAAARRTPLADAEKLVIDFGAAAGKTGIHAAAWGLFETLNGERSEVMAGIERYGQKQKAMAEALRKEREAVAKALEADAEDYEEQFDKLQWNLRIFDERQKSLTAVCEVPVIIERRLYGLVKKLEAAAAAK